MKSKIVLEQHGATISPVPAGKAKYDVIALQNRTRPLVGEDVAHRGPGQRDGRNQAVEASSITSPTTYHQPTEGNTNMATAGVRPVVEQVCDEQVHNGGMFTAHDITLEVRNRGHRVGHHEVRDAVHDYFARGGLGVAYTRTTISVPAGGTPFLYHRTADDPAAYANIRGVGLVPNPSVNTISVPPPSSISSTDDEDEDEDDEDEDDEDDDDVVDPSSPGPAQFRLRRRRGCCHSSQVQVSQQEPPCRSHCGRAVNLVVAVATGPVGWFPSWGQGICFGHYRWRRSDLAPDQQCPLSQIHSGQPRPYPPDPRSAEACRHPRWRLRRGGG